MDGVAVGSLCPEFLWLHNLSDSAYILSVGPKWPVHCTLDVVHSLFGVWTCSFPLYIVIFTRTSIRK
jgi:hypothetical protein